VFSTPIFISPCFEGRTATFPCISADLPPQKAALKENRKIGAVLSAREGKTVFFVNFAVGSQFLLM